MKLLIKKQRLPQNYSTQNISHSSMFQNLQSYMSLRRERSQINNYGKKSLFPSPNMDKNSTEKYSLQFNILTECQEAMHVKGKVH